MTARAHVFLRTRNRKKNKQALSRFRMLGQNQLSFPQQTSWSEVLPVFLSPLKMAALADSVLDALVYEHLSKKDKTFAAVFQKKFQSVSKCCYSKCSLVLSEVSDGVFFPQQCVRLPPPGARFPRVSSKCVTQLYQLARKTPISSQLFDLLQCNELCY